MVLVDSPSDRHIVRIFDKDQKNVITTILAIPNYRLKPTGKTVFGYWEVPAGQPRRFGRGSIRATISGRSSHTRNKRLRRLRPS